MIWDSWDSKLYQFVITVIVILGLWNEKLQESVGAET